MNYNFYNSKFTLITQEKFTKNLPDNFINFTGKLDSITHEIKQYELDHDEFFSGHIIVNSIDKLVNVIGRNYKWESITDIKLNPRQMCAYKVIHSGVDSECEVNNYVLYCSSFVLPIIGYTNRTSNNIYGNMMKHRIEMLEFNLHLI